jgi:CopG family nickel-responsive transcriptional regulator
MQRVTVTLDDDLVAEIDRFIETRAYQSRSEAFRDLVRTGLQQVYGETGESKDCVAALAYVYNHDVRDLAKRLAEARRDHHDLTIATTTVDHGHESSFEVALLRGATVDERRLAQQIIAERGVRHGRLTLVPVEIARDAHAHGSGAHPHDHYHVREAG